MTDDDANERGREELLERLRSRITEPRSPWGQAFAVSWEGAMALIRAHDAETERRVRAEERERCAEALEAEARQIDRETIGVPTTGQPQVALHRGAALIRALPPSTAEPRAHAIYTLTPSSTWLAERDAAVRRAAMEEAVVVCQEQAHKCDGAAMRLEADHHDTEADRARGEATICRILEQRVRAIAAREPEEGEDR